MIRVGITGQPGFVGTHLFNELGKYPDKFERIPFEDAFFEDTLKLRAFVKNCDVVVHLAAMMRSPIQGEVYRVNMGLTHQLINAMDAEKVTPAILFSSSIQEGNGSEYAKCKEESRYLLSDWAKKHNTGFVCMLFPNLFGPNARPNSHSFIATFCYKLTHGEEPQIIVDNSVKLKYIKGLLPLIIGYMDDVVLTKKIYMTSIEPDIEIRVSEVLAILNTFKDKHCLEENMNAFEKDLLETYFSYKNYRL